MRHLEVTRRRKRNLGSWETETPHSFARRFRCTRRILRLEGRNGQTEKGEGKRAARQNADPAVHLLDRIQIEAAADAVAVLPNFRLGQGRCVGDAGLLVRDPLLSHNDTYLQTHSITKFGIQQTDRSTLLFFRCSSSYEDIQNSFVASIFLRISV